MTRLKPTARAIRDSGGHWQPSALRHRRFLWWSWQEWVVIGYLPHATKEEALQAARRWRGNQAAEGEVYYGENSEVEKP